MTPIRAVGMRDHEAVANLFMGPEKLASAFLLKRRDADLVVEVVMLRAG